MSVKVRVNQQDFGNRIVFGFFKDDPQSPEKVLIYNGKDQWVAYDYGVSSGAATLSIPPEAKDEILQQLADLLGSLGFKPAKLKAAIQETERVENHLLDTINVRDRLLTIIEKQ